MLVEILHGVGGEDSKVFVGQLAELYERYGALRGLKVEVVDSSNGRWVARFFGPGAGRAFALEAGKHCVQRIPDNDRSGRRQTSFVSVAVLPLPPVERFEPLPQRELETTTQTGRQKAGGQNANKVASAVRMKHRPTGLCVFINGRDQIANRREALRVLTARVNALRNGSQREKFHQEKSSQLADRGRGGKVRTYNFLDNYVEDHRTCKRTNDVKSVMKGKLELIL